MSHMARLTVLVLQSATNSQVITYCLACKRCLVECCFVKLAFYVSQQKTFSGAKVWILWWVFVVDIRGGEINMLSQTIL